MAQTTNGRMGRPTIFRDKEDGDRVQGIISKRGSTCFENARHELARLAKLEARQVSDADTIEYLARGEQETRRYLRRQVQ